MPLMRQPLVRSPPSSVSAIALTISSLPSALIVGGWIGLVFFILTTLWIIAFKQEGLVEAWPPSENLYAALGMEIEVKPEEVAAPLPKPSEFVEFTHGVETEIVEGQLNLIISGKAKNNGNFAVEIPNMR